jgi:hypothetical protein
MKPKCSFSLWPPTAVETRPVFKGILRIVHLQNGHTRALTLFSLSQEPARRPLTHGLARCLHGHAGLLCPGTE